MSVKNADSDAPQIQIRFVTKQQQYAVPDFPLSVPAAIIPTEFNSLVHELLKESKSISRETEFDFLVCKEFLRTSLLEHINERGLSTEDVVDVEYLEKHPPPEPQDCLIHDDWVSAVAVCENWILTGCYDNTLRIWTAKGKHRLTIPGHVEPVKAVAWISLDCETGTFVSVSLDQTAVIWNWNISKNSVNRVYVCKGHSQSLESVGINLDGTTMATGSWDTMIKIWSTSLLDENEDGELPSKRSKTEHGKTRTPKRTIKGHKEVVSGVAWTDSAEIITSSWDRTLKIWDSELSRMKHEVTGNKGFLDMDYSRLSRTVITGCADRHVRLYDPRSTEGSVVKSMFTSHTQWVPTVRWSTTDEHLFISGAYDHSLKLWDTRSPKAPLYELTGHEEKVLSSNWSNPKLIVSGGADNTVRIFKSRHALR